MRANAAAVSVPEHSVPAQPRQQWSDRDEPLLKIDLSDLVLPQVNDLHVDGLRRSWLSRLFNRH